MAAREVAVGALGTIYAIDGGEGAADKIGQAIAGQWSLATALALLAWYVFAPQCASTLAVIRRETGSWKWMWVTFGYMLALAYAAALSPTRSPARWARASAARRAGSGRRRGCRSCRWRRPCSRPVR